MIDFASKLTIFYCDAMTADAESFSPSDAKPKAAVESWRRLGIPIDVLEPTALGYADFCRVHDPAYVESILSLQESNGFGNRSPSVAESLPYTSGAMLAAAIEAIRNRLVAVAPCSGFHHAGFNFCSGFCTFNGLLVAAAALKAQGLAQHVGILDFDQHYGDGTDDIIGTLHIDWIVHYSAGRYYRTADEAGSFLCRIPDLVGRMKNCDVILYQAGADPHIDDPLGGWLTTEQLRQRDRAVFATSLTLGIPIAWNLAGGYQTPLRKVLDIHDNTLCECASVFLNRQREKEVEDASSHAR
ncbi:MAG TPA: hypothetical protein VHB46_02685 [Burkholderiales bacterium]|nr:hypothetical protein [Burkholderiales bacterium]